MVPLPVSTASVIFSDLANSIAGSISSSIRSQAPFATFQISAPFSPQMIVSFFGFNIRTNGELSACAISATRFRSSMCLE